MKTTIETKIFLGIILISLLAVCMASVDAKNEGKYRLVTDSTTSAWTVGNQVIEKITAVEQETQQLFLNLTGDPNRVMIVYYNVKYTDGTTTIYYTEMMIPFDTETIQGNNLIKKDYIERYALDTWNWVIPNQRYGYDRLMTGNQ